MMLTGCHLIVKSLSAYGLELIRFVCGSRAGHMQETIRTRLSLAFG